MTTGRLFFLALLVALVYFSPQWMAKPEAQAPPDPNPVLQSARDLQARKASEAAKAEALERVLRDAERRKDSLTREQLALIDDLKSARSEAAREKVSRRLVHSLENAEQRTLSFAEWAADTWYWAHETYRLNQARAQSSLWGIAILLVLPGFAGLLLSWTHLARVAARFGFRLSRGWLVVLSFLAIALVMITRTNPWADVPLELVLAPVAALIGCGFALRIVDFNYPVWNSLVRGCGAPLISMAFSTVYLQLVSST